MKFNHQKETTLMKLKMMKTSLMSGASASLLGSRMTPAERALGRFLRAPDHPGGDGSGADAGAGAGAAAPAAAEGADGAAAAAGADGGAAAAEQVTGSDKEGGEGSGKPDAEGGADDDSSIAGGAGAEKDDKAAADVIGAPEAYDVKVPEALAAKGMAFDKEVFDLVEPALRDMNLSNAAAQRLADVYAEKVIPAIVARSEAKAGEATQQHAAAIRKEWADASRADPEIGGADFDKTVDACAQVWDKFGIKKGEGIRQLLDESGLGNHPDMLRFLSRVSKGVGEGQFISPSGAGADTRPIWDRVYGQPEPAKT